MELTKEMLERVQKIELEMLIEVDRICKENAVIITSILNELV